MNLRIFSVAFICLSLPCGNKTASAVYRAVRAAASFLFKASSHLSLRRCAIVLASSAKAGARTANVSANTQSIFFMTQTPRMRLPFRRNTRHDEMNPRYRDGSEKDGVKGVVWKIEPQLHRRLLERSASERKIILGS